MKKRKCNECGKTKLASDYYRGMAKCKDCWKARVTKYRKENLDKVQEYDRKRAWLPHRVKARKEIYKRWKTDPKLRKITNERSAAWRKNNKVKRAAHIITGNAIRDGKLIKQPCEICGKKKVQAHHNDYDFPMNVRWLCKKHHMAHHKNEREKLRNK